MVEPRDEQTSLTGSRYFDKIARANYTINDSACTLNTQTLLKINEINEQLAF